MRHKNPMINVSLERVQLWVAVMVTNLKFRLSLMKIIKHGKSEKKTLRMLARMEGAKSNATILKVRDLPSPTIKVPRATKSVQSKSTEKTKAWTCFPRRKLVWICMKPSKQASISSLRHTYQRTTQTVWRKNTCRLLYMHLLEALARLLCFSCQLRVCLWP